MNARVVLCGVISSYVSGEHPGPANYVKLLAMRARMKGFNTLGPLGPLRRGHAELRRKFSRRGSFEVLQPRVRGLDQAVPALNALFEGTNIGKTFL